MKDYFSMVTTARRQMIYVLWFNTFMDSNDLWLQSLGIVKV